MYQRRTGPEVVAHNGHVDPIALGRRIGAWLEGRGFQTEVIAADRAVWTPLYVTSSLVFGGVSFVTLTRDLLHFVRQELRAHGSMMQAHSQILDVVETVRFEQSLGSDERTVDNSESDTTVTRSMKASKRQLVHKKSHDRPAELRTAGAT